MRETEVAVVGGGVVGTAIGRELARGGASCTLLEARADVGAGTSKANTALLHTGFDAKPGTLESALVRRGHELLGAWATRAGIPLEPIGALLVAWSEEERSRLPEIAARAAENGYEDAREVVHAELRRREPALGDGAVCALEIPGEAIVCPFTVPLAYAREMLAAGGEILLSAPVQRISERSGGGFVLETGCGRLGARFLVNAAGLQSDELDRMAGHGGFTVTPRRGELLVFDKLARGLVNHILLAVPTPTSKGVLVSPTVYGNVMVGPTAVDIEDRGATATTPEGLAYLSEQARRIVPALASFEVTAAYAGLRAATEHADYQLRADGRQGYVCVGGIRSTGLSASLAIAEHVAGLLEDAGLELPRREDPPAVRMPYIGQAGTRPYADAAAIARDPEYGRVVCFCERVSSGEIRDALDGPLPARDLDGLRRRTRVLMGRCQGFYCRARVQELLDRGTGGHRAETACALHGEAGPAA